ncbi:MAG: methylenetetrahydrofolate reductase [NAD(P)H] [Gammaproteobacteria bacterium]|nr:methylenetetrahydrofolate reductase [NAD(P)H] [Gammaproteobacteria bacterium]
MTQSSAPRFSYEFFPPRNLPMQRRFWRTLGQLERFNPDFFSMTYGALGSAKRISIDTVLAMQQETAIPVAAHLTCADGKAEDLQTVLRQFDEVGIQRIVALRGDASEAADNYAFKSIIEFIEAIKNIADFDISVAAYPEVHPQARSANQDLQHLKSKFDAGANRAITQFFFDTDTYLRFRDRTQSAGIDKPILPGILPIHNFARVKKFAQDCGASVPVHIETAFAKCQNDPQASYDLSLDLAVEQCEALMREGVDQFHLYTLNKTDMCLDISLALGATVSARKACSAA